MKPIVVLASVTAALLVGAGIYSVTAKEDSPAGVVTDSTDNPFAGLEELLREEIVLPEMTEEEEQAERDYLRIDLSPKPDPETLTEERSSTENVPYRSCEKDPYVANRAVFLEGSIEASAKRAIYSLVRFQRVLATKDCTCQGKVAPFQEVIDIIDGLEKEFGPEWNRHEVFREYTSKARGMRSQIEAFCGGEF